MPHDVFLCGTESPFFANNFRALFQNRSGHLFPVMVPPTCERAQSRRLSIVAVITRSGPGPPPSAEHRQGSVLFFASASPICQSTDGGHAANSKLSSPILEWTVASGGRRLTRPASGEDDRNSDSSKSTKRYDSQEEKKHRTRYSMEIRCEHTKRQATFRTVLPAEGYPEPCTRHAKRCKLSLK